MSSNEPPNGDPSRTPPPAREPDRAHSPNSDPAYHGARPGAFTTGSYAGASDEWAFAAGAPSSDALSALLARNWWAIALRGVFAILFGIVALAIPGVTIAALVLVFGVYMLVDGVFDIIAGVRAAARQERWGLLVVEGIVDLIAGVIALVWPLLTVLAFVILMAVWAVVSGGVLLGAAFRLHVAHGRWFMGLAGAVSIAWGVLIVLWPLAGAVVLTWWMGAYALLFGGSLLALAFRLRRRHHEKTPSAGGQALRA